jgi:hypothetical protein
MEEGGGDTHHSISYAHALMHKFLYKDMDTVVINIIVSYPLNAYCTQKKILFRGKNMILIPVLPYFSLRNTHCESRTDRTVVAWPQGEKYRHRGDEYNFPPVDVCSLFSTKFK